MKALDAPRMTRRRLWIGLTLAVLLAACAAGLRLLQRPSIEPWLGLALPPAQALPAGQPRLMFLGVSTLLISDGETAFMTDGFFSRPPAGQVLFGRVAPDAGVIGRSLQRAGVGRLAAVIALHSHYDHVLDSAEVARRTGALLVGTPSTAQVGRGGGLAEERMRVVKGGEVLRLGRFEITVLRSAHFPHAIAMGEIDTPLQPPARAGDYREGGSLQLLVRHGERSLLVVGSAGMVPGALAGRHADVALLGVGGLGREDATYRDAYWNETVRSVGARRVVPIHWDDFTLPLDAPLQPMRRLVDELDTTLAFLSQRSKAEGVELRLVLPWQAVDPFAP